MDQTASQTIAIFRARADSAIALGLETRLADLDIESLDLALILLDIEDAFGIDFPYDPDEEGDAFATVGGVVERVRLLVEARRSRPLSSLMPAATTRGKSLWLASSRDRGQSITPGAVLP
jgi:acyl carrier protein